MQNSAKRSRAHAIYLCLGLVFAGACGSAQVKAFSATPNPVCEGGSVHVAWSVEGRASVAAAPTPSGWVDGEVASVGSRSVSIASSTTFTVVALDANPAKGGSFATQPVDTTPHADPRGALAACSADKSKLNAHFKLESAANLRAKRIYQPESVSAGKSMPRKLCVSHDGKTACIDGATPIDFDAPAAGDWTLSADVGENDTCERPPMFRVRVDFGCD